ncbi:YfgM family protein [Caldimonas tepidiphila]|uniref:YfgM family protein n=1 Tax=Caldimonas tepidiphila TaxID=2315841 RepID=UPI000E5BCDB0|nr:tetratricopeptide repeat protein [Caldimonas tepidiphila]
MATHLDEQEQLEDIKHFWKRWGTLITGVITVVLLAFAAWNGWSWWQRDQAAKAGVLYDEVERAAQAGDAQKAERAFSDMRERYGRTAYAEQAGLLAARVLHDKGENEKAEAALAWVGDNAREAEYRAIARLRRAALLLERKAYDEALKLTEGVPAQFEALAADRRGDILRAQGQLDQARAAYQKAWAAMPATQDYRQLVEAKLTALGAAPAAADAASGAAR